MGAAIAASSQYDGIVRLRVPGWLAWAIAAVAVLVGVAIVLLHTPQAARWGRDRLVRLVAEQLKLDLAASRLDVNLFTRRIELDDVRLSVPGHAEQPFFTARRIRAELPWAVYTGTVRLSMLDVVDSRVHMLREGGVLVNLPPSSGGEPPEVARRFDLRGLRLTNFTFDYEDRSGDSNISVKSLDAALDETDNGATGTLTADWLYVRLGAHATTSEALDGRMGFDGSNIRFEALNVPLPEGRLVVDGQVNRALDETEFALTIKGGLDYAVLTAWTPPPVPVSGTGTFDGTFVGPFGGYELKGRFASPGLTIGRSVGMPLDGTVSVTPPRTVIDQFTIVAPPTARSPRRGVIEGRFTYQFGVGASDLAARFRDLDLDVALAAYDREPLVFAAWEEGTLTLSRASPRAPMVMRAAGTSRALARADRVALDGTWTATLENERWFARHDHQLLDAARASGTVAWPAAADSSRALLSGPLALDITHVGRVVAAARRSGINLSAALDGISGPATGTLTMGGSLARMVISGHIDAPTLALPSGQPLTAAADIVYDGDSLQAPAFALTTPGGRMSGDVVMGMQSSQLAGTFRGEIDDLGQVMAPFASATGVLGTATFAGTIGGTTGEPDVPFTVRSTPIEAEGQIVGVVEMDARLRGTVVEIARLDVDQGPGTLRGSGTVDYETGAYDLTIDGQDLTWKDPSPDAQVAALTVRLGFTGAGTFDTPGGSGTLTVVPSGGVVGDVIGRADVRWQFTRGQLATSVFFPALRTLARATIEPRAPYAVRGVAAVNAIDVQPLATAYGAQAGAVTGTLGMSASFEGTLSDTTTLRAFVNLQQVDITAGGLPVRLERPSRVTVSSTDFGVDDLVLTVGKSTIQASGQFRDVTERPLTAKFSGNLSDVTTLARAFGAVPEVTASGALTASWESRGGLDRAQSTVTLTQASVTLAGYPSVQALDANATFDGQVLLLDRLSADWQGGLIAGSARLPRAVLEGATVDAASAGRVDVTVKGLTQKALAPWLAPESIAQVDARLSATLALDVTALDVGGVSGTFVLDEAAVTAAGVPIAQERPARLSIADGTLTFDDVEFSAGSPVRIGGTVTMREDTELNLAISGTPGLRPFSVLSPDIAVDGAATVDLKITGTPSALAVDGRVDLDDAEIVMRDPQVIASDINGAVLFQGDRVTLSDVRGFLNGGDLEASGSARVLGVDVATGEFTFQARSVAVEYPKNVDSEIDAILSFQPGAEPLLRGDVRVRRGAYRATISVPALVAFNATRTTPVQQPGYLDRLRLDLSISTEEDIFIDNNYGRFEAGANVRLQGTGTRPALTGRAELREGGEVFLLGGLYRLNESTISFSNPNTIAPEMNISMVTRSNGAEQTLTLTGTLDRLQTDVTSTDPTADTSVANLLLGGGSTLTGDSAIRLLSGELLGVTGRAIGLDSLRLERGFTVDDIRQDPGLVADIGQDPATRLTLSKQLSSDVEVVLSQGISQGALSGYVNYRPLRGVELRGTTLDNTDRLFSIRHDISFGGTRAATTPRRVLPKIATVSFEGVSPQEEAALRGRVRLEAGDDFDFIRWRDDVERMRTWYRDRDQLEARVRAARADTADGRVALTYRVTPGPRTELRIEGMPVPASLRNRIDEIWSNAVFDKFLLDEIQNTVRFELLRQNTFNAKVEAVVESTSPTKVIRVAVTDGQTARSRRIVYEGARTLSPGELDTEVARWGLSEWGWLYPPSIANALYNRYDAEGYRGAVVNAAEPVIVNDEALLTVSIDEGGQTIMTSATLASEELPLADEARRLVTAMEGRPYRYGDVDTLVRQLEERYRNAGYNEVRVRPDVTATSASTSATLVVDIEAGPEQRLAAVVVTGADKTRPESIVTALRLTPGEPVNFTQWAEARKRVFDTNVFRQVDVRPETLPEKNADGTEAVRARVTVSEWPTWRLRYGLQLDDTEGDSVDNTSSPRRRDLGAVANLQNRNLFGRAWTFGVYGRVARKLTSANTYLSFPTFFGRAVQTNLFTSALQADIFPDDDGNPLIRQNRTSVSLEQRIRRLRAMEIVYGYRVTRDEQDGIDPDDFFYQAPITGRFTGSAFFDHRDDPFNASRGWFGALSTERVSEFESGGDSIKVFGRYYRYLTVQKLVLASAFRLGGSFLDPLTSIDPFLVGGADTVRGFQESRIGPRTAVGTPAGGNAVLILNQEVRAPLYRFVRGVAFVDAGNVFQSNSALSLSDLKVGYGVGLRFHTPFSVFRIDLGFAGNPDVGPDGQRRRPARWYFGLGQVF